MEKIKLFDSELQLMELIWRLGKAPAKEISKLATEEIGWNKNTTYTILKKLVEKNVIQRTEPNFICIPLITRGQVQIEEARKLIDKLFNGSVKTFFSAFVQNESLSQEEIEELKKIIQEKL